METELRNTMQIENCCKHISGVKDFVYFKSIAIFGLGYFCQRLKMVSARAANGKTRLCPPVEHEPMRSKSAQSKCTCKLLIY